MKATRAAAVLGALTAVTAVLVGALGAACGDGDLASTPRRMHTDDSGGFEPNDSGFGPDETPPGAIDLRAFPNGFDSIRLEWDAPGGDGDKGRAARYEVKMASQPIETEEDFDAAKSVDRVPAPVEAGVGQAHVVTGLTPNAEFFFAMRARDAKNNAGPLSKSVSARTLAVAKLQIAEVAPANSAEDGFDFVELVALSSGRVDGVQVRDIGAVLYTLGALTLAQGDRVVIHLRGFPCGGGDAGGVCAQEDLTGNKAGSAEDFASPSVIDVYAASTGMVVTDNVVQLKSGTVVLDAVALSNRDGDSSKGGMEAFAELHKAGAWKFGAAPVDGTAPPNTVDCPTQEDTVSVATNASPRCATGAAGAVTTGKSLQRTGTTDTDSRADWTVAPQSRGQ